MKVRVLPPSLTQPGEELGFPTEGAPCALSFSLEQWWWLGVTFSMSKKT